MTKVVLGHPNLPQRHSAFGTAACHRLLHLQPNMEVAELFRLASSVRPLCLPQSPAPSPVEKTARMTERFGKFQAPLALHRSFRAAGMPDATALRLRRRRRCRHWLLHLQLDVQVAKLFGLDGAGRIGHQAGAFRGFRERDDVADARRVAEDRDEAIKPKRDAAVRGRAVFERFEHVTEPRLHQVRRNLEQFLEDGFLHVGLMDTDRATAEFHAVHHDVVVLAADFLGVGLEQRDVVGHGCGERMMAGIPAVLFAVEPEQRKFDDPEEIELIRRNRQLALRLEHVGAIEPDLAEDFARGQPLIGGEQDQVAFLDLELGDKRLLLGVVEKLYNRRFPLDGSTVRPFLDLDVGKTFRAKTLGVFGHRLDLALRRAGHAFRVHGFHHAAVGNRAAEHLEGARLEFLGEIHEFHAKTSVGLVNAVAVQRFLEADALERRGHVRVECSFPDALEQTFDERVNVFAFNEAHFDVQLRELGLTIGAQILVAITARELKIFLHARDHENLFELLRRLRQRIERPRLATIRHEKFARTFGRRLEQRGRLDFEEALFIHETTRRDGDLGTRAEVARHFRATQVEISILQAQLFIDLVRDFGIVHGERQDFCHVQNLKRLRHQLDFAGRNLGVVRAGGTLSDLTRDADHAFAAQGRGLLEQFFGPIRRIEHGLRTALAVADINEDEAAEIAPGVNPAGERDGLPEVSRAQFVAMMRAFHLSAECGIRIAEFSTQASLDDGGESSATQTFLRRGAD